MKHRPSRPDRLRIVRMPVSKDPDEGIEELSARERIYCEMAVVKTRWTEWIAGRRAARKAVAGLLGPGFAPRPDTWDILPGPPGDPRVHGTPRPVWVSITHAAGVAVAVASFSPVGADLERPVRPLGPEDAPFLLPHEAKKVWALPPGRRSKLVTTFWTLKEAAAKAVGLAVSPYEIGVRLAADDRTAKVTLPGQPPLDGWVQKLGPCLLAVVRGPVKGIA